MNSRILILTISNPEADIHKVELALDKAKDWLRYAPGTWLIHTKQSAKTWYARIKDSVSSQPTVVFLCEVNLDERAGQLSPHAWKWIDKVQQTELLAS